MADDLRPFLEKMLPGLEQDTYTAVLQKLEDLGVESLQDMKFIKEDELFCVLKPIHVRKLLHSCELKGNDMAQVTTQCSSNTRSTVAADSIVLQNVTSSIVNISNFDSWAYSYTFNESNLKKDVRMALTNGEKLTTAQRHEFVRIVIDDVLKWSIRPITKVLRIVVNNLVNRYPQSLQDKLDGQILGNGYESLLSQFVHRVENVTRDETRRKHLPLRKRKKVNDIPTDEDDENHLRKQPTFADSYGCICFDPEIPDDDIDALNHEQECLKYLIYNKNNDFNELKKKLIATFSLQRKHINSGHTISSLLVEWPFLFEEIGMMCHLQELLGKDMKQTMEDGLNKWMQKCLDYFNLLPKPCSSLKSILSEIKSSTKEFQNTKPKVSGFIMAILTFFNETPEILIQVNCPVDELQKAPTQIPLNPCILVSSASFLSATTYCLAVDGHVVNNHITDIVTAINMLFGSFYCFNIYYPSEVSDTLEFLQRCVFSINPTTGHGKQRSGSKIKPKVLKLINNLSKFDWTPM